MSTNNDLSINLAGLEAGRTAFKSFLLSGERNESGLTRENSDEAKFARFFEKIPQEQAKILEGYFRRQKLLSLSQRKTLLGEDLTNISINTPLTTHTTSRQMLQKSAIRNSFGGTFPKALGVPPQPNGETEPDVPGDGTNGVDHVGKLTDVPGTVLIGSQITTGIQFELERLRVTKSQDAFSIFGRSFNTTDEVTLSLIKINEIGEVSSESHDLGDIKDGETKTFDNKVLCSFDVPSAGANEPKKYPKIFTANLYAIERDQGGYNDFIEAGAGYVQEKVTEELIANGIISLGEKLGITIPPSVANYIASYVKGFFDEFVDWLSGLFENADDVIGLHTRAASINSLSAAFNDTDKVDSRTVTWHFFGADGGWETKTHWSLKKSPAN